MDRRAVVLIVALAVASVAGCRGSEGDAETAAPPAPDLVARSLTVASLPTVAPTPLPMAAPPRAIGTTHGTIVGDDSTTVTNETAPIDGDVRPLSDLEVGHCVDLPIFADPPAVEITTGTIRACDEPHDAEVYARVSLNDDPDAPFPGDDQVQLAADTACLERFEPYVGLRYVDARLEIVHLRPPHAAWTRGDRIVVCAVVNAVPGPLVGTVARSET